MWLAAVKTLTRVARLGERERVTFVLENLNTKKTALQWAPTTLFLVRKAKSVDSLIKRALDLGPLQCAASPIALLILSAYSSISPAPYRVLGQKKPLSPSPRVRGTTWT